jgi:hypothetical protein
MCDQRELPLMVLKVVIMRVSRTAYPFIECANCKGIFIHRLVSMYSNTINHVTGKSLGSPEYINITILK